VFAEGQCRPQTRCDWLNNQLSASNVAQKGFRRENARHSEEAMMKRFLVIALDFLIEGLRCAHLPGYLGRAPEPSTAAHIHKYSSYKRTNKQHPHSTLVSVSE